MNDIDITRMFEEKNLEILKNKLKLDIQNNIDSLLLTMNNIIELEYDKLWQGIKIEELKVPKLTKYFLDTKTNLTNTLITTINDKQKTLSMIVDEMDARDQFIYNYRKEINDTTKTIKKAVRDCIRTFTTKKEINNLLTMISKDFKLDTNMRNRIIYYLNYKFPTTITNKIVSQLKDRDIILNNIARESYTKYLDLNSNLKRTE